MIGQPLPAARKPLKILTAGARAEMLISTRRIERHGDEIMTEKTCAACDCQLDADPIRVKVGGKTVEVCCEECATALNEAGVSAAGVSED
ncbi:hypothetical protein CK226_18305 [Mesorhizobium sp. WSM4311]|nr:hypothetical protein CK232_13765 [Mesorhizobium sp. WSM4304]PBB75711.1 hypothetical protein CK227_08890 [Mesorhizobium sp. WSM4308]PBC21617.1 hypothetical protein CK226_18305 [Mesorhizobium sp. WSM4311]